MGAGLKIATVVGARPQFIKAAVFSRALQDHPSIQEHIIHTGQHFHDKMSEIFFHELNIPAPHYNLEIHGLSHGHMTGRMMEKIEEILLREPYDAMLVYGDTNSTLAGALVAAKLHIPIIHVEAGLRSYDQKMPEEINRVLTDHISTLLFCPTQQACENLKAEGITKGVFHVGDIMYDATLFAKNQRKSNSPLDLLNIPLPFCFATIHRAENTDNPEKLKKALDFIRKEAQKKGLNIVFPLHPRTQKVVEDQGLSLEGMRVIDPQGYLDTQTLLSEASCVFTDSGGMQKEAYFHRIPCITLRDTTEWVETIESGWNRLWNTPETTKIPTEIEDYGKGDSANQMISILKDFWRD